MESKEIYLTKVVAKNAMLKITCLALFIGCIAMSILFTIGIVDYLGLSTSVLIVFNDLLFGVLQIEAGNVLEILINLALSIIYIIIIINLIKNIVNSIKEITNIFSKDAKKKKTSFEQLFWSFRNSAKYCLIWYFLCSVVSSTYKINTNGIVLFALVILLLFLSMIMDALLEKMALKKILHQSALMSVVLFAYICMVVMVQSPIIENFRYALSHNYSFLLFVQTLIISIAWGVLQFFVIDFFESVIISKPYSMLNYGVFGANKIMITSIIVTVVNVVLQLLLNKITYITFEQVFMLCAENLAIIFISVAMFIACNFTKEPKSVSVQNVKDVAVKPKIVVESKENNSNESIKESDCSEVVENTKEDKSCNIEILKKYKELLDAGVITQEEFDEKKKQYLGF